MLHVRHPVGLIGRHHVLDVMTGALAAMFLHQVQSGFYLVADVLLMSLTVFDSVPRVYCRQGDTTV